MQRDNEFDVMKERMINRVRAHAERAGIGKSLADVISDEIHGTEKKPPFTGYKPKWIGKPSPKSMHIGSGWFRELNQVKVSEDEQYAVMSRPVQTEWGEVIHVCIRNATSTDIPWAEKQRIKNELFGVERIAIEVFPKESQLIDEAPMYHLWVLPEKMELPFGIHNVDGK